ncbi:hypothetical protein [Winogradskyella flava]|uniref:hypothetical protein n=1 Tax=Winogradskyella flava TaxID=1884876 RepID=UPI0024939322|nr:hypothetical protein [Winogradskyella flava]
MDERSEYYTIFGSIMKITLKDGNSTKEEERILQAFGKKLGLSSSEYFDLLESYDKFKITPLHTRKARLENFYRVVDVVYNNTDDLKNQIKWLERMGIAMGFNPSNIKYIVLKSLDLFKSGEAISESVYVEEINTMNS